MPLLNPDPLRPVPAVKWNALFLLAVMLFLSLLLASCATAPKPETPLMRIEPSDYPVFSDEAGFEGLDQSIAQTLRYLERVPAERTYSMGPDQYTADHLHLSFRTIAGFLKNKPSAEELNAFIRDRCIVYRSIGEERTGQVLFTGYFEPLLMGRRTRTAEYRYPVYGVPDDLTVIDLGLFSDEFAGKKIKGRVEGKTFVPYPDRSAINRGAISASAPVLCWVKDRAGLFFLHVQGSGQVELADGTRLHIHYNNQNGRAYTSIGGILIREGHISREKMSMQAIKAWLAAHPEETDRILNANQSYIFFGLEDEGPKGALNIPLTPERSLAVDRRIFPLPGLAFVRIKRPVADPAAPETVLRWEQNHRFMVSQDTGGAIKGPGRADYFWGGGPYAELAAGHMKHRGDLFFLVLRPKAQ